MANNKNFKVKNSLDATKLPDFAATTTSVANGPDGLFSTTLYTGTGSSNTVTTGIDLSGSNEGLVWIKNREATQGHYLFDTVRGAGKGLRTHGNFAEYDYGSSSGFNHQFTSTGFSLNTSDAAVNSTNNFVSWTWKSAPKFFDVVTYTGDGYSGRTVSHSLGSVPGMIIVKNLDQADDWAVFHNGLNFGQSSNAANWRAELNEADGRQDDNTIWNDTLPTSTVFSVGTDHAVNANGENYVAYLFAHNNNDGGFGPDGDQDVIKCGNFVTDSNNEEATIDLGFEPQWILFKRVNSATGGDWNIYDNVRGQAALLEANTSDAEDATTNRIAITSTGFTIDNYGANRPFIYVAIRKVEPKEILDLSTGNRFSFTPTAATIVEFTNPPATGTPAGFSLEVVNPSAYALTWPSSIKWHGGSAPTVNAGKAVYVFITTDGGTTYFGKLAGEGIA